MTGRKLNQGFCKNQVLQRTAGMVNVSFLHHQRCEMRSRCPVVCGHPIAAGMNPQCDLRQQVVQNGHIHP